MYSLTRAPVTVYVVLIMTEKILLKKCFTAIKMINGVIHSVHYHQEQSAEISAIFRLSTLNMRQIHKSMADGRVFQVKLLVKTFISHRPAVIKEYAVQKIAKRMRMENDS